MKLQLDSQQLGKELTPKVIDFISTELAMEVEQKGNTIIVTEDYGDLSQTDLFQMGVKMGKETERAIWSKPESFELPNTYIGLLEDAINSYQKDHYITVDTIDIISIAGSAMSTVIVKPTKLHCLFVIFNRYGQLVHEKNYPVS